MLSILLALAFFGTSLGHFGWLWRGFGALLMPWGILVSIGFGVLWCLEFRHPLCSVACLGRHEHSLALFGILWKTPQDLLHKLRLLSPLACFKAFWQSLPLLRTTLAKVWYSWRCLANHPKPDLRRYPTQQEIDDAEEFYFAETREEIVLPRFTVRSVVRCSSFSRVWWAVLTLPTWEAIKVGDYVSSNVSDCLSLLLGTVMVTSEGTSGLLALYHVASSLMTVSWV